MVGGGGEAWYQEAGHAEGQADGKGQQLSELNLLLVRQAYLNRKVKLGHTNNLAELRTVHSFIQQWYQKQCEKIKLESRASEFQESEKVTIYHHEIHKKLIRKSAILKLQTPDGLLEGHDQCAAFLEKDVKNLLLTDANLDHLLLK